MILGMGTDIVDARRIGRAIDHFPTRFINRIFTEAERHAAAALPQPHAYFAKRFAAKEAVYKALSGKALILINSFQPNNMFLNKIHLVDLFMQEEP